MQQTVALRRAMLGLAVVVSLSAGTAAPETEAALGKIDATVLNSAGVGVGNVQVLVLEEGVAAVTDASGRALLKVQPNTHLVTIRRIGCPEATQTVTVTSGATSSVTFTLACFDRIMADVPSAALIAVPDFGLEETGAAECRDDLLPPLTGTGSVIVPGNATLTDVASAPCHVALLLLAADRAPVYRNTAATLPWTGAMSDVVAVALPPTKLKLPVRILVAVAGLNATERADLTEYIRTSHLSTARSVLDVSFSGVELVDDVDPTAEPQIIFDASARDLLDGYCADAAAIRGSAYYSSGRINIYYLAEVLGEDGGEKAGYSCGTSDAPEIIFIDADNQPPFTLVHEVGHALGLSRPDWGHSEEYIGAYRSSDGLELNVMAAYGVPATQQHLSVGQVAQMHLNAESWLNRPSATDGSTLRERFLTPVAPIISACTCPETASNPDCPALSIDIPREGTLIESTAIKACTVTPDVTAIDVCVGTSVTVDATFSQGPLYTSRGSRLWVSLSPGIVRVVDASTTYPWNDNLKGKFTGVAPGTAIVRAYVDGSFAPITVKVKATGVAPC